MEETDDPEMGREMKAFESGLKWFKYLYLRRLSSLSRYRPQVLIRGVGYADGLQNNGIHG